MRLCRIIEQYWTSWYLEAREIFWKGYFLVNSPFNFFLLNGNTSYGWVSYTFTQPSPLSAIQTSETFWRVCSFQLYVECSSASWASNWFSVLGSLTPGSPPWPGQIPTDKRASPALHGHYYFPSVEIISSSKIRILSQTLVVEENSFLKFGEVWMLVAQIVELYFTLILFPAVWSCPAHCLNNSRQDNPPSINPPSPPSAPPLALPSPLPALSQLTFSIITSPAQCFNSQDTMSEKSLWQSTSSSPWS